MITIKKDLIKNILQIEWDMFRSVSNNGGTAPCQEDAKTFEIMRASQAMSWTEVMLESYLEDLIAAQKADRNLMTEKYARMMKNTFPDEYVLIVGRLPALDTQTLFLMDRISAMMLARNKELKEKYPNVIGAGRPLYSTEDSSYSTSLETYSKRELSTYSAKTLGLFYDYFIKCMAEGLNNNEVVLENTVKLYGFTSIEQAEKAAENQHKKQSFH